MSVFDRFRTRPDFRKTAAVTTSPGEVHFQISLNDLGEPFLQTVDPKGKSTDADYRNHSGNLRRALRSFQRLREREEFSIDWDRPDDTVYVREHPYLLDQVRQTGNLLGPDGKPVDLEPRAAMLELRIDVKKEHEDPVKTKLAAHVALRAGDETVDQPLLLDEQIALAGGQLYELPAAGPGYAALGTFDGEIFTRDELPLFLSLFYSQADRVPLRYADYDFHPDGPRAETERSLLFERVDEFDTLYLRVLQTLPGLPAGVLEEYELTRLAQVRDEERQVLLREVDQLPLLEMIADLENRLDKQSRALDKEERVPVVRDGTIFAVPPAVAERFIAHDLPELLETYQVLGAEKLRKYNINANPPRLDLKLDHGIDFLAGDADLEFGDQRISVLDAIAQFNRNRYIKLGDGTQALLEEAYLRKLERLFKREKDGKVHVSFFDLPLVEELIGEKTAAKTFGRSRVVYEGFNRLPEQTATLPEVNATLRPYQVEGFKWLDYLNEIKLNGCLADDMGLGKTLQTITLLAKYYPGEARPTLLVMPRSLLANWKKEVDRFAPQITHYTYYGTDRKLDEALAHHLIFTTYAIMRNDIEQLREQDFFYLILDESQAIKNVDAQTTKAAMLLNGQHRLALSGTPVENNLSELYSLFRFLNPAMFGTLQSFGRDYLTPIQKNGDETATRSLRKKIFPFVLRRLKKDVLQELPDKIEQTLYVEMSDAQRKLYEQRRRFYKEAIETQIAEKGMRQTQFFVFQALNELRQIATVPDAVKEGIGNPKADLLMEQLTDTIANGHKALVFVNFLAGLEQIGERLDAAGIGYVSMSGATRKRQRLVDQFQNDPNVKVFVMTLKTGGTGLNLTAADTIFLFDPWWNVAAENQAIDRAHRIGQTNKVLAYRLITEGTIEEKIQQLQEHKRDLVNTVLSADTAGMKALSEEDIDFILG